MYIGIRYVNNGGMLMSRKNARSLYVLKVNQLNWKWLWRARGWFEPSSATDGRTQALSISRSSNVEHGKQTVHGHSEYTIVNYGCT